MVGLIFLLKKRQALVAILGGSVLAILVLGEAFLLPRYLLSYFFAYNFLYSSFGFYFNFFLTIQSLLFLLWLIVGTRFFLRSANTAGGLLFGIFLILWAGSISILGSYYYSAIYYNQVAIHYYLISLNYYLGLWIILPAVLGIIAIIIALRKRQRKQRAL